MSRDILLANLRVYQPWNEQESFDRDEIIRQIEFCPDIFTRENRSAHMSASSWIVNRERTKVLMVYHNIYQSWSWTGGHADGETDLLSVALREAREETGIQHVHALSPDIFSLEILTVDGHEKRGQYVSFHLHLNLTYLLEADESDPLIKNEAENSAVGWFPLEEALTTCRESWMRDRIYRKLNQKLAAFGVLF